MEESPPYRQFFLCVTKFGEVFSTLDKHSPLIIKAVSDKKWIPWFNCSITKEVIMSRQSLERAWRRDKSDLGKYLEFYHQWRRTANLLQSAEMGYYKNLPHPNCGHFKETFSICNSLPGRNKDLPLPSNQTNQD